MLTKWHRQLIERVKALGGFVNAHLHLDRAETFDIDRNEFLIEKQRKIKDIKRPIDEIETMAVKYISWFKDNGYRQAWTTADNVGTQGLFIEIRNRMNFDLRVGAYSPTGINDSLINRVKNADFVCGTPEIESNFMKACEFLIELSSGKELHLHIDQSNSPHSHDLESLCELKPVNVWVVHGISPSCYGGKRFFRLVDKMLEYNIGLICCPSAALGMFQDRSLVSPLHNSIARIREMYKAGIKIRLGSDNICDMFSPSTGPDLLTEIIIASNAIRWYDIEAWAIIASGHLG